MGKEKIKYKIQYKDIFNFERLIKLVLDWLKSEDYLTDEQLLEKFYMEKRTAGGKEVKIWWDCAKQGSTKYFKRQIKIDFVTRGMNDVEVIKEGQKIAAQKGELNVEINGTLLYGEDLKEFQVPEKSFLKKYSKVFEKRIYKEKIQAEIDEFRDDLDSLRTQIKQYLDLKGFIPALKAFHVQNP